MSGTPTFPVAGLKRRMRRVKAALHPALDRLGLVGHLGYRRFIVVTRSRSGSNLLIGLLNAHRRIIARGEIFQELQGRSIDSILGEVFTRHPRRVRAVGFKIFYYHPLDDPSGTIWKRLERIEDLHVIHLKRRNLLRVLTSWRIAEETGRWFDDDSGRRPRKAAIARPVHFTRAELVEGFEATRKWEEEFGERFRSFRSVEVRYEELVEDRAAQMRGLTDFLGVEPEPVRTGLRRQNPQPLSSLIGNYAELKRELEDTPWAGYFED